MRRFRWWRRMLRRMFGARTFTVNGPPYTRGWLVTYDRTFQPPEPWVEER